MQKVRFWDPEHWRFRAEETRTVADQMTHEEARGMALKLSSRNVRHEPHTTHVSGSQRRSSRLVATAFRKSGQRRWPKKASAGGFMQAGFLFWFLGKLMPAPPPLFILAEGRPWWVFA